MPDIASPKVVVPVFAELLFNNFVVCKRNPLFIDFTVTTLCDVISIQGGIQREEYTYYK